MNKKNKVIFGFIGATSVASAVFGISAYATFYSNTKTEQHVKNVLLDSVISPDRGLWDKQHRDVSMNDTSLPSPNDYVYTSEELSIPRNFVKVAFVTSYGKELTKDEIQEFKNASTNLSAGSLDEKLLKEKAFNVIHTVSIPFETKTQIIKSTVHLAKSLSEKIADNTSNILLNLEPTGVEKLKNSPSLLTTSDFKLSYNDKTTAPTETISSVDSLAVSKIVNTAGSTTIEEKYQKKFEYSIKLSNGQTITRKFTYEKSLMDVILLNFNNISNFDDQKKKLKSVLGVPQNTQLAGAFANNIKDTGDFNVTIPADSNTGVKAFDYAIQYKIERTDIHNLIGQINLHVDAFVKGDKLVDSSDIEKAPSGHWHDLNDKLEGFSKDLLSDKTFASIVNTKKNSSGDPAFPAESISVEKELFQFVQSIKDIHDGEFKSDDEVKLNTLAELITKIFSPIDITKARGYFNQWMGDGIKFENSQNQQHTFKYTDDSNAVLKELYKVFDAFQPGHFTDWQMDTQNGKLPMISPSFDGLTNSIVLSMYENDTVVKFRNLDKTISEIKVDKPDEIKSLMLSRLGKDEIKTGRKYSLYLPLKYINNIDKPSDPKRPPGSTWQVDIDAIKANPHLEKSDFFNDNTEHKTSIDLADAGNKRMRDAIANLIDPAAGDSIFNSKSAPIIIDGTQESKATGNDYFRTYSSEIAGLFAGKLDSIQSYNVLDTLNFGNFFRSYNGMETRLPNQYNSIKESVKYYMSIAAENDSLGYIIETIINKYNDIEIERGHHGDSYLEIEWAINYDLFAGHEFDIPSNHFINMSGPQETSLQTRHLHELFRHAKMYVWRERVDKHLSIDTDTYKHHLLRDAFTTKHSSEEVMSHFVNQDIDTYFSWLNKMDKVSPTEYSNLIDATNSGTFEQAYIDRYQNSAGQSFGDENKWLPAPGTKPTFIQKVAYIKWWIFIHKIPHTSRTFDWFLERVNISLLLEMDDSIMDMITLNGTHPGDWDFLAILMNKTGNMVHYQHADGKPDIWVDPTRLGIGLGNK